MSARECVCAEMLNATNFDERLQTVAAVPRATTVLKPAARQELCLSDRF